MEITSAIALIDQVRYKPGWKFEAEDHTNRYEGCIKVKVTYPAAKSERKFAADEYPEMMETWNYWRILCGGSCSQEELYRKLMEIIIKIEIHEAREFFRVAPTFWAPFHPHKPDGMERWGEMDADMAFGIA